ncbi:PREDICTED: oocyte-expressed protein homolog [Galeopterus variegatus]|uniref:Oocyte-expressed protein homolog n=1 Tax=Galeopterus variegatus TaxID=482537 RepID=A0ABM0SCX6_GALVR|nr:PREDICTED: oocyte-expressed protein homolog [Galeopterus variegatus]
MTQRLWESGPGRQKLLYLAWKLPGLPLPPPWLRIGPWWFPAQALSDRLVFHLEAWLADAVFGPDRAIIPEMQWMSQALLTVDITSSRNLVEITVFGRPRVQNRVKNCPPSKFVYQAAIPAPYQDQVRAAAWKKLAEGPSEPAMAGVTQRPSEDLPSFIVRVRPEL